MVNRQNSLRVLVLGANGFIGSHLCDRLLKLGHHVRAFDRPGAPPYRDFAPGESITWHWGDFRSKATLDAALDEVDIVYHLISTTNPKTANENPMADVQSNVVHSIQLLDLIVSKSSPPKLIFVSSGGTVYGIPQVSPISENHPTEPISAYGLGKLTIEKYINLYRQLRGLDSVVLRLSNPYGPGQKPGTGQGVIATFVDLALKEQPIEIWGDGTTIRDYLYISDAVTALSALAEIRCNHHVYNIGSGVGHSLNVVISAIEETLGRKLEKLYKPSRGFDARENILDISRIISQIDWTPQTELNTGLLAVIDAFRL